MSANAEAGNAAPVLFPVDFEVIMKLLPRAQITVGDIPNIYPSLGRIEQAARSREVFRPELRARALDGEKEVGGA